MSNGYDFIQKAIELGATAIICDDLPRTANCWCYLCKVVNTNSALAFLAANYYKNPSSNLKLVGITGHKWQNYNCVIIVSTFQKAGFKVGLISTVKIMVDDVEYKATHTTPDSLTINHYLNEMVNMGCDYCFMEVSSHGVHQKEPKV